MKVLPFDLGLPFSWTIFFFSALLTSVANLIYALRCPYIVKAFGDYEEFSKAGNGPEQVIKEYWKLLGSYDRNVDADSIVENVQYFIKQYCTQPNPVPDWENARINLWQIRLIVRKLQLKNDMSRDAFWFLWDFANDLDFKSRLACMFFYTFATVLASVILVQNVCFVVMLQL